MMSSDNEIQSALTQAPDRGPEQSVERLQLRTLIEARINLLPETFRSVFILRAIDEMCVDEVAEVLDIPAATVRTRYFRARALLRESLAQEIDATYRRGLQLRRRALRPYRLERHGAGPGGRSLRLKMMPGKERDAVSSTGLEGEKVKHRMVLVSASAFNETGQDSFAFPGASVTSV